MSSASLTWSPVAEAAGLGRLNVQSALGQPLRAEIEITSATSEELASLNAKLASQDVFRSAGVEYNAALLGMRFNVDRRPGRPTIIVTSQQPINEPFIGMLLELTWANGRLVREYTFLLDPPELRVGQRAPAPVAPTIAPSITPTRPAPVIEAQPSAPAPAPAAPRAAAPAPKAAPSAPPSGDNEVTVKRGDTLGKIARDLKPEGVTLDQMLVALFRDNPEAFAGNNMNRLRSGAVLRVPDAARANETGAEQARKTVLAQTADFSDYRNRLAGATAAAPAQGADGEGRAATGQVTPKVDDKATAKSDNGDKVKLARPDKGAAKPGATGGGTLPGSATDPDAAVSRDRALNESKQRIAELERNVGDLKGIVGTQSKVGSEAQKAAEQRAAEAKQNVKPSEPAKVDAPTKAPATSTPDAMKSPEPAKAPDAMKAPEASKTDAMGKSTPEAMKAPDAGKPAEAPKADAQTPTDASKAGTTPAPAAQQTDAAKSGAAPTGEASKADPNTTVIGQTAPAQPAQPAQPPAPKRVAPTPEPQPESGGFVADLLGSKLLLGGVGGIVVLLLLYAFYSRRNKKKMSHFQDSILTGGELDSKSIFDTTGGQSINTTDSTFNSSFTPSASQIDSNEVDPIAEADVYIAYGRDAQAEEILKEALKTTPERHAIRVKLLEICASRRDVAGFDAIAGELYNMTGGQGDEWQKAAALGRSLDPRNPLYGAAGGASETPTSGSIDTSTMTSAPMFDDEPPMLADPMATQPLDQMAPSTRQDSTPLDFDLSSPGTRDMDDDPLGKTSATPVFTPRPMPTEPTDDRMASAPSLDFDLGTSATQPLANTNPTTRTTPRDLDFNVDIPSLDSPTVPSSDFDRLEAETKLPVPEVDLSDISLDLSGDTTMSAPPPGEGGHEMSTKLDLAAAYKEIGDKEGAKELLDEVLKGGNTQQQQRARQMLETLN